MTLLIISSGLRIGLCLPPPLRHTYSLAPELCEASIGPLLDFDWIPIGRLLDLYRTSAALPLDFRWTLRRAPIGLLLTGMGPTIRMHPCCAYRRAECPTLSHPPLFSPKLFINAHLPRLLNLPTTAWLCSKEARDVASRAPLSLSRHVN